LQVDLEPAALLAVEIPEEKTQHFSHFQGAVVVQVLLR
jgi:hypothetical protein